MKKFIQFILVGALCLSAVSCEDFLDRPTIDGYNTANFYQTDEQCLQGVNYLYNSPWYDIIRYFMKDAEIMAGNVYVGQSAYSTLTVNGTDTELKDMSYSLWAENAQCNTVINNLVASEGPSQAVKNQCIGEALAWKAMAYFCLVRCFGDVPIIHNNTESIKQGDYNDAKKVAKADVYEYIIMTLEKAMTLLPKNPYIGQYNRIDYYAAEALLAKVYLTRAGVTGVISTGDLAMAAQLAKDVIDNSGRTLTPKYSDVFRLHPSVFNQTGECLFSWLWTSTSGIWTAQNSIQCDVAMVGFDEFGDTWGGWNGVSIDLADHFGVSATDDPVMRQKDTDDRRKATMMMPGDYYEYFWQDKGGFDVLKFVYEPDEYGKGGPGGSWQSSTGALYAKHLYGDAYDHESALGVSADRMCNQLPTHILRLSDIYLVYAEASLLTGNSAAALEYVNKVRERANAIPVKEVNYETIWNERRLELALEGDRWFDYVRRSYYDVDACITDLLGQRRSFWGSINETLKPYVCDDSGAYAGMGAHAWDASAMEYIDQYDLKDVKPSMFTLPFPSEDVVLNPNMGTDGEVINVNVRETYNYDNF